MSPYIRTGTGPRWRTPECGDGIDASRGPTRGHSAGSRCRPATWGGRGLPLQKDLDGGLRRAAALDEGDGLVEVDIRTKCELSGRARCVAGALESLPAPPLDPLSLCL